MPRDELHLWAEGQFQKVFRKVKVLPMRGQSLTVALGLSSDGLFVAAAERPAQPHDVITVLDGVHVPLLLIREIDEKGSWYQLQAGGKYVPLKMARQRSEPKCCEITPLLAQAIVSAIHDDHKRQLRERINKGFLRLLELQFPRDDLYLYELLQNATDDGATKVSFEVDREPNALVVQHNGRPFHAADILGLASVCLSTKGGRTIGFMGIGFKTVYKRFAEVTCSDALWHFRFAQPTNKSDRSWKMLPKWVDDALAPDNEFSCRFTLADPSEGAGLVAQDMSKLPDPVPPLLARRVLLQQPQQDWRLKWGSRELCISLENEDADEAIQRLRVIEDGQERHWLFVSHGFEPTDKALDAFYKFRDLDRDDKDAHPGKQQLTLFCELSEGCNPISTTGVLYAVLPTDIELKQMDCHLQGNWLPSADRQQIPKDNAWNLCVIEQLPNVMVEFLRWVANKSPDLQAAYRLLPPLSRDDGSEEYCVDPISGIAPINAEAVRRAVKDERLVPVLASRIKWSWAPQIKGPESKTSRVELIRHLYEHVGPAGSTVALKFRKAGDVLRLPRLFTDLFTAEFLEQWLGKPVFLANCVGEEGRTFWDSLEVLDVPDADGLDESRDRLKEILFAIDDRVQRAWFVIRLLAAVRTNETSEGFTEVPAFIPIATGELRRPKETVWLKDEFFNVERGVRELLLPYVESESDLVDVSLQHELSLQVTGETAKDLEDDRKHAKALLANAIRGQVQRELSLSDILAKFFAGIGSSPLNVETVQRVVAVTRWARKKERRDLVSHVVCKTTEGFQLLPCQDAFLGSKYDCDDVEIALGNAASFVFDGYLEAAESQPDDKRLWRDFFASDSKPAHPVRTQLDLEWIILDRYTWSQRDEFINKYAIEPPDTRSGFLELPLPHGPGKITNDEYVVASPNLRHEWDQALQDIHKRADRARAEAFARVLAQRSASKNIGEHAALIFYIPYNGRDVTFRWVPGRAACWIERLRELQWVPSMDRGISLPGNVLLKGDLSRPDAPTAVLDDADRNRLESLADVLRFGEHVPRSSVAAGLVAVAGSRSPSTGDWVKVWSETVQHIHKLSGQEQAKELEQLRDVATRYPVFPTSKRLLDGSDRVDQSRVTLGSRNTSLGGWLVELGAEGNPLRNLANAISQLLNLPERPTAEHALALWLHCSQKQLSAKDCQGPMVGAYKTLIEELSNGSLPILKDRIISHVSSGAVRFCCTRGTGQHSEWIKVDDKTRRPVYNDAPEKSSLLRDAEQWIVETLLSKMDHPDADVFVNVCGLTRLSDTRFSIRPAIVSKEARNAVVTQRLQALGHFLLAVLENHEASETLLERGREITTLHFRGCKKIQREFVVDKQTVSSDEKRAVIMTEDNDAYVVGKPTRYCYDLEEAVLQHLGASEHLMSLQISPLFSNLEDGGEFAEVLTDLCCEAGIDMSQLELLLESEIGGENPPLLPPLFPRPGGAGGGHRVPPDKPPKGGPGTGVASPPGAPPTGTTDTPRPAARDWFRVRVSPESGEDREHSDERVRELRDDKLARAAVVRFEEAKGRKATPMDDLQPGYDVKSDDSSRGVTRLIEVKGVTDKWEETATVRVSNRQFEDGRNNDNSSIEYWLYVVDSLGTHRPLVRAFRSAMKIPAHFYFQAQDWLNSVDEQGEVDMAELPIAADSVPEFEDHASL